jgi:Vacuolar sorting protein 9 (VPS9) domain
MEGERFTESIWYEALTNRFSNYLATAAAENMFVCIPQTCSLNSTRITRRDIENHILRPTEIRGELETLSGKRVSVAAPYIKTISGFKQNVISTILSPEYMMYSGPAPTSTPRSGSFTQETSGSGSISTSKGASSMPPSSPTTETRKTRFGNILSPLSRMSSSENVLQSPPSPVPISKRVAVYFISRPLEGGLAAPSAIDEMEYGTILKMISLLRSSPETEVIFGAVEGVIDSISTRLQELLASNDLVPEEALVSIQKQLVQETELTADVLLNTSLYSEESDDVQAVTRKQLKQVLESTFLEPLHDLLLRVLARSEPLSSQITLYQSTVKSMKGTSQDALHIKKAFQTNYAPAIGALSLLSDATTPLEKLHCFRDATSALIRCVERHLEASGADLADVDLATDDILDMLVFVLVEGAMNEVDAVLQLPLHLDYASRFHFAADDFEISRLGYYLANFQQALGFFEHKANETRT